MVLRRIAQRNGGQRAKNAFNVIRTHTNSQTTHGHFEFQGQCILAGHDAAHEHIAAPTGIFGQGMRSEINGQTAIAQQVKGLEGNARAPCVV